ncbi:hypothetical protein TrST_g9390 [Triparma strigata]|uniref:Uncharacterized protein n=1 Tax=Triparma strigata TaxID=1606541 RepID=A0A9W7EMC9_9STRA|nr:hypothetical protein TrST_g9390 [Triparma strigata]
MGRKQCDICDVKESHPLERLLTLLKCRKCGLKVHKECYDSGGALSDSYRQSSPEDENDFKATFVCHPCSTPDPDDPQKRLHPFNVSCCLCSFKQDPKGTQYEGQPNNARPHDAQSGRRDPHAFHKVERWRYYPDGSGGEEWGGPDGDESGGDSTAAAVGQRSVSKQLWCHTICGFGLRTTGLIWGADVFGESDSDPFDHFQLMKSEPFKIPKGLDKEEEESRRQLLNSFHVGQSDVGELRTMTKKAANRCSYCTNKDHMTNRMPTQCNAGNADENGRLSQFHKPCNPACGKILHVGCSKYCSKTKMVDPETKRNILKPRRTYFYPGLNDYVEYYLKARAHPDIEVAGRKEVARLLKIERWDKQWKKDADVPEWLQADLFNVLKRQLEEALNAPVDEIFQVYCPDHAYEIAKNMGLGHYPGGAFVPPPDSPLRINNNSNSNSSRPQDQSEEENELDLDEEDQEEGGEAEAVKTTTKEEEEVSVTATVQSRKMGNKKRPLRAQDDGTSNRDDAPNATTTTTTTAAKRSQGRAISEDHVVDEPRERVKKKAKVQTEENRDEGGSLVKLVFDESENELSA